MTVIVCAVSQFSLVNVKDAADRVPSSPAIAMLSTTSLSGCASRTTVNVSVDPPSDTPVDPPDSTTVKPATSSSSIVKVKTESSSGSKLSSEVASITETVMSTFWFPSMRSSSTPVTVTFWGLFQFCGVNVNSAVLTVAAVKSPETTLI